MLRAALSRVLFPVVFGAALWAGFWGVEADLHRGLLLAVIFGVVVGVISVFERVHPEHPEWNVTRGDVGTDLLHAGVSGLLVPRVVEGLLLVVLAGAIGLLSERGGLGLWPDAWPLAAQLIPAMLVS